MIAADYVVVVSVFPQKVPPNRLSLRMWSVVLVAVRKCALHSWEWKLGQDAGGGGRGGGDIMTVFY